MSKISSLVLLSKSNSLDAMQIEISFAAANDFNQYTQYVPRPADFDPFPAPPRIVGKGGFPAPPHEKNSFPVHPYVPRPAP